MRLQLKTKRTFTYALIFTCIPFLFFAKVIKNNSNAKEQFKKTQSNYTHFTSSSIKLSNKKNIIPSNVANQPIRFIENKGQIKNTNDQPVPFVLFKVEASGMDVYITEKGISYVFVKSEENEEERERDEEENKYKKKHAHKFAKHEEKMKTELSWVNVFLKDASIKKENIIKENPSLEHFNYFDLNTNNGIYNIYQYEKITIKNVYPNIDWVFYNSDKKGMKYDFIVHPGADAKLIKLIYDSEKPINIDSEGNINIKTRLGTLSENAPFSYVKETQAEVKTNFVKNQINNHQTEVSFNINTSEVPSDQTLIIDPQLEWGTFIGGNGLDGPLDIAIDHTGNVYITGYTVSANFPLQVLTGAYNQTYFSTGGVTSFITKYDNLGVRLWSTIYRAYQSRAIAIDNSNNLYIVGDTYTGFSTQNLAGAYNQTTALGQDLGILKFDASGARLWATYFGGSDFELVSSITTDNLDNVYITGVTMSLSGTPVNDLPMQNVAGAYNQSLSGGDADAFLLKFNSANVLQWSTYYGGSGYERPYGITADNSNTIYLTGETESTNLPLQNLAGSYNQATLSSTASDAFIAKFNNLGALQWSTYYGGNNKTVGYTLITDNINNLYVYGGTLSTNLSLQNLAGAYNQTSFTGTQVGFIMKFDNLGIRQWATYYGGNGLSATSNINNQHNLAVDNCNNLYVGITTYTSMPSSMITSSFGYDLNTYRGGVNDAFITKFSNTGTIIWDSYIGGNDYDIRSLLATDNLGNLFMAGEWCSNGTPNSTTYPLANINSGAYYDPTFNGGNDDGCILKFSPLPLTTIQTQTNNLSCTCNGIANISITSGEAPYTYEWSNGTVLANTTVTLSNISGLCSGVYQVTVTSSCNSTKIETYTITGTTGTPSLNITTTNSVLCGSQTATLSVVGTGTVNWSNGSTSATTTVNSSGIYTATLTNSCGTAINSITITAMSTPTISSLPTIENMCAGQSATLTATSGSGSNYLWNTGATTNSIIVTTPGIKTVTVSNVCGAATASVNVISNTFPSITLTANTQTLCPNETATLTVVGGFTPYVWSNSTSTNSIVTSSGGTVSVSSTNVCGTITQTINIIPINLNASISATPISGDAPLTVNFTNNSNGATTYLWNFGNNSTANTQTVQAITYPTEGTYNVYLTITDGTCTDVDSLIIIVLPEELGFVIPNVFTPNGDSINDVWHFSLGKEASLQSFSIYNRWGNLIKFSELKTQNYINWDGRTTSGEPLSGGVYFYILQYKDAKGNENKKSGFITLIR